MMRILFLALGLVIGATTTWAAPTAAEFEQQLAAQVAAPEPTIVHLWAPWCPNCRNEMRSDGWAKFVAEHPSVRVVFVNIWHGDQDPAPKLAAGGLGGQSNFTALNHPNPSRRKGEQLARLLDLPVSWVPTTWVFSKGRLRYALNYGEVRFDMLHQMVSDVEKGW